MCLQKVLIFSHVWFQTWLNARVDCIHQILLQVIHLLHLEISIPAKSYFCMCTRGRHRQNLWYRVPRRFFFPVHVSSRYQGDSFKNKDGVQTGGFQWAGEGSHSWFFTSFGGNLCGKSSDIIIRCWTKQLWHHFPAQWQSSVRISNTAKRIWSRDTLILNITGNITGITWYRY